MKKLFFGCIVAIIFWSCNKDDTAEKMAAEDQKLTEYMQTNLPDATNVSGGLYINKLTTIDDSPKPEAGKFVLIDYMLYTLYDNVLERVSYMDYENYQSAYPSIYKFGGPEIWQLTAPLTGISECIGQMHEGETSNIFFSSRHNVFYPYADFTTRKLWLKLVKVIDDITVYQENLMSNYLKNCTGGGTDTIIVQSTVDNNPYKVMFRILNEGTGEKIGDNVEVKSTASASYLIQDRVAHPYVSNEEVKWNTANNSNLHTFTKSNCIGEILKKMKKGGKVALALPYRLVYGDKDENIPVDDNTGQCVVPMYSVLIYEITLTN